MIGDELHCTGLQRTNFSSIPRVSCFEANDRDNFWMSGRVMLLKESIGYRSAVSLIVGMIFAPAQELHSTPMINI